MPVTDIKINIESKCNFLKSSNFVNIDFSDDFSIEFPDCTKVNVLTVTTPSQTTVEQKVNVIKKCLERHYQVEVTQKLLEDNLRIEGEQGVELGDSEAKGVEMYAKLYEHYDECTSPFVFFNKNHFNVLTDGLSIHLFSTGEYETRSPLINDSKANPETPPDTLGIKQSKKVFYPGDKEKI